MIESVLLTTENIPRIVEETKYTTKELTDLLAKDDAENTIRVICYITKENWEKIGEKLPQVSREMGVSQTEFLNRLHREIEDLARTRTQYLTELARVGTELVTLRRAMRDDTA